MIRESGMPGEGCWRSLFDMEDILQFFEIDGDVFQVAEFACGYGTFSKAIAERISGTLYGCELEKTTFEICKAQCSEYKNIILSQQDCFQTDWPSEHFDRVLLFNILHCEKPRLLLQEAKRILHPEGKIAILLWRTDVPTPRGPPRIMRPTIEQVLKWLQEEKLRPCKLPLVFKHHFGILAYSSTAKNRK